MVARTADGDVKQKPEQMTLIRAAGRLYFPIALVARLPYAMMVVGVLTLVVSARGQLELGGFTSAMAGIGTAVFGPLIGAAADRVGQRFVVLIVGIVNSLALVAMAVFAFSSVSPVVLLVISVVIGASAPQVSPMSRSRLVGIIHRQMPSDRHETVISGLMAYESAADEIVFVFGPFIVGLLATTLNPAAPIIGAAVLTLVFVSAFALHPSGATRPLVVDGPRSAGGVQLAQVPPALQAPLAELFRARLLIILVGVLGMGFFFGSMLTALTAFLTVRGHPEQAGLIYGVMGIGSASLALGVAWFSSRFTLRARSIVFAALLVVASLGLVFATTVPEVLLVLLVAGFGVGPTLVTLYSFGTERSPRGRSATVMTMLGSGLVLGQAASSAIVGAIAQADGAAAVMPAPAISALIILSAAIVNWFLTGRTPRSIR